MYDKLAELYDLFYDWKDYGAESEKIRQLVADRNPFMGRVIVAERPDLHAVGMNGTRVEDNVSFLDFHYLAARPGTVEHLTETHRLGLFTDQEYRSTFENAGLSVEHDTDSFTGRGLWIGQR